MKSSIKLKIPFTNPFIITEVYNEQGIVEFSHRGDCELKLYNGKYILKFSLGYKKYLKRFEFETSSTFTGDYSETTSQIQKDLEKEFKFIEHVIRRFDRSKNLHFVIESKYPSLSEHMLLYNENSDLIDDFHIDRNDYISTYLPPGTYYFEFKDNNYRQFFSIESDLSRLIHLNLRESVFFEDQTHILFSNRAKVEQVLDNYFESSYVSNHWDSKQINKYSSLRYPYNKLQYLISRLSKANNKSSALYNEVLSLIDRELEDILLINNDLKILRNWLLATTDVAKSSQLNNSEIKTPGNYELSGTFNLLTDLSVILPRLAPVQHFYKKKSLSNFYSQTHKHKEYDIDFFNSDFNIDGKFIELIHSFYSPYNHRTNRLIKDVPNTNSERLIHYLIHKPHGICLNILMNSNQTGPELNEKILSLLKYGKEEITDLNDRIREMLSEYFQLKNSKYANKENVENKFWFIEEFSVIKDSPHFNEMVKHFWNELLNSFEVDSLVSNLGISNYELNAIFKSIIEEPRILPDNYISQSINRMHKKIKEAETNQDLMELNYQSV